MILLRENRKAHLSGLFGVGFGSPIFAALPAVGLPGGTLQL